MSAAETQARARRIEDRFEALRTEISARNASIDGLAKQADRIRGERDGLVAEWNALVVTETAFHRKHARDLGRDDEDAQADDH